MVIRRSPSDLIVSNFFKQTVHEVCIVALVISISLNFPAWRDCLLGLRRPPELFREDSILSSSEPPVRSTTPALHLQVHVQVLPGNFL